MIGINGKNKPSEKIALVDNLTTIKFLEQFSKESYSKIITFDYCTHDKLTNKKIPHELSDTFSSDEVVKKAQKQCYSFSKWYDLPIVSNNFSYFEINLGKLYTDQFIPSLVSLIKKFIEFKSIYENNTDATFFASGDLLNIVKIFTQNFIEINQNKTEEFYFDKVNTEFKIAKNTFVIPISQTTYQKIKNNFEKILGYFFGVDLNKKNTKFTLLVELNTKSFGNFFLSSKKHGKNILYYGRRRPAIWDIESFKIIKKSECKIFSTKGINVDETLLLNETATLKNNFLKILNDTLLENFFKINSIPIISIIKPKLLELIFPKIPNFIYEIEIAKTIFDKQIIDSIIVISEIGMTEQIVCTLASKKKVPIFHLQEGFHYDTLESYDNSFSQGVFPSLSDYYLVWGHIFKKNALENGHMQSSKIIEIGSPRFSNLFFNENYNKEDYILLATMPPQIEEMQGINSKNLENYLNDLEKICNIVHANKQKLIIKLHPTKDVLNISKKFKSKFPNVKVVTSGDINPLIRNCSCVIVTGISTVIIQAQILMKPVISIPLIDYNFGIPSVYTNDGCLLITLSELPQILTKLQTDLFFRKRIIENGRNYLKQCMVINNKTSSDLIWDNIVKTI